MSEANVKRRSRGRSQKPGCVNNTQQKRLLAAAGHTVWARNLLTERWTPMRLRPFFGDLPVARWFNPSASLLEADGQQRVGFNPVAVDRWIGLKSASPAEDPETCPNSHQAAPCPVPEGVP